MPFAWPIYTIRQSTYLKYCVAIFINMIRLRPLLTESVTIQGVRLQAKAPKTGGGILATYGDMQQTYRVSVDTAFYDGPVGVTAIWEKSPGNYAIADNTGKTFSFDRTDIGNIIAKIKQKSSSILISKMAADITLTKTA